MIHFRRTAVGLTVMSLVLVAGQPRAQAQDEDQQFEQLTGKFALQYALGQYRSAERIGKQMQELAEGPLRSNPVRLAEALAWQAHACVFQGRLDYAESLYLRAKAIADVHLPPDDQRWALGFSGLAMLYKEQGRYAEALPLNEKALRIWENAGGPKHPQYVAGLANLGACYLFLARYPEAELLLKRALDVVGEPSPLNSLAYATVQNSLAVLYQRQSRYRDAAEHYLQALESAEKYLPEDSANLASLLNNLGGLYADLGEHAKAETLLRRSIASLEKHRGRKDHRVATGLQGLAIIRSHLGDDREAEALLVEALEIEEKTLPKDHPHLAITLNNLGMHYHRQDKLAEARKAFDRAIEIFDRTGFVSFFHCNSLQMRGEISWRENRRQHALADLRRAMDLGEQQRALASGGETERAMTFGRMAGTFETMVRWQCELGDTGDAFRAIERAKARSLLDQLALQGVDLLTGVPDEEARQLRQDAGNAQVRAAALEKKYQLAAANRDPADQDQAGRLENLERDLRAARQAYADAYVAIRNASPVYRVAGPGSQGPISLDVLAPWLAERGATLLQYLVGFRDSFILVVPPTGKPRLAKLALDAAQAAALGVEPGPLTEDRFKQALANDKGSGVLQRLRNAKAAEHPELARQLAALGESLLPATERALIRQGSIKRLIVIPDAAMAGLPLETLSLGNGNEGRLLADFDVPVSYCASATVLRNLAGREARAAAKEPVLTVGACRYTAARAGGSVLAEVDSRARYGMAGGTLPPLPYSGWEVQWLAEVFGKAGTDVAWLKDNLATEAIVRGNVAGRRVLHFACHGLVDQQYGNLFGALALTPGANPEDPADDGFLTLAEIYPLNLKGCELAILSACDTNVGPQQRGEGVWALSRGFLVAGARRVVATNWLVDDEAAASLVSVFCGYLAEAEKQGKTPDYAQGLHDAKRWVRTQEKWKSPYYWGSFVLVGPP